MAEVVILGGGPGGYEAALVAAQSGAVVTIIEPAGLGGAAVLTDCVPSKTLIATAESAHLAAASGLLGVRVGGMPIGTRDVGVDLAAVNRRIRALAAAQSADIAQRCADEGIRWRRGWGRLVGQDGGRWQVAIDPAGAAADPGSPTTGAQAGARESSEVVLADTVLIATGARPRSLPGSPVDGERILTWQQVYHLEQLPERLIVIGSGVTGAEFAGAYLALGSEVTLVSSRSQVLPGEDPAAAAVIDEVFRRRGMTVCASARAVTVRPAGTGVVVTLADGRVLTGSHALLAIGSVPTTDCIGADVVGLRRGSGGQLSVDRVSRTNAPGVYAAGDCTGVLPLASVAAMQGRIAMWHALGDAVRPLDLMSVASAVFTEPEIASVGVGHVHLDSPAGAVDRGDIDVHRQPLGTNARAKMLGIDDGFVTLYVRRGSGRVLGGVVVAPRASELIYPVAQAVECGLTVDDLVHTFTVYPSLSGSIPEAARRLRR